ncbi:holin [Chromobacterium violaceum]|uniref:holin n=1 Tax=Chromobacterium violaceum TaxID=536 RepID=UPI0009D94B63|nr:holin [Chromobacterium violaceum]OQS47602.1 holin [Chromobacterium violaceum]OQS48489.1 holin [Chromobacterium violaceum]
MQEHERGLAVLVLVGAAIGLAKLLDSNERITIRLAVGRAILGGATSAMAGLGLAYFPEWPLPVLIGAGAALGVLGSHYVEALLRKHVEKATK